MINVRQVVSVRFREVHRHAVLQPRDVAHGGALHPAHQANVRCVVHEAVVREKLLDKRWRRYWQSKNKLNQTRADFAAGQGDLNEWRANGTVIAKNRVSQEINKREIRA